MTPAGAVQQKTWTLAPTAPVSGQLADVSCPIAKTCMAVGYTSLSAHLKHVSRPPALGTLDAVDLQALELGDQFS
jgi:hypothetical protein